MSFTTILILLLLLTVGVLVFYIFYLPPKMVTIVERPVYDYGVSWVPWSWGSGGYGWPGAYYVNRPMPHFGPRGGGSHGTGHGPSGGGHGGSGPQ
jgi:hypothetical protein